MARATSTLLLLAGAMLLVTWLVSPAASAPPLPDPVGHAALDAIMPALVDVNSQIDQLRAHLVTRPDRPVAGRDPFAYGPRAAPSRAVRPVALAPVAAAVVTPSLTLVAIVSGDANAPRRAALSTSGSDDVQVVATGDAIGRFVVREIHDDDVVLADSSTAGVLRLTLR